MAASPSALPTAAPSLSEKDVEKTIEELDKVKTEDEYESRLSRIGLTAAKWMKVLFNAYHEEFKAEWLTIDEYKSQAHESMSNAWHIVNLPDWTVEKRGTHKGDIVESKRTEHFGKVYMFTGTVECPPKFLYDEFRDNLTRLPEWNPTILKSELIKEIGPGVDLSYQVTTGGGRGIIAPRDFVILRRNAPLARDGSVLTEDSDTPHSYISSGVSVSVPGYPPRRELVRGQNKVGCWYLRPKPAHTAGGKIETHTTFQWLMCCDLKGKIPQFILDTAFATVMLDYIVHVRKFAADAKTAGKF